MKDRDQSVMHDSLKNKVNLSGGTIDIPQSTADQALLQFKSHYPRNRVWQLAVDGKFYARGDGHVMNESGWINYETREPGCLQAIFAGLNKALENIENKKMTLEFIQGVHAAVTADVPYMSKRGLMPGVLREVPNYLFLFFDNVTADGLADLLNAIEDCKLSSDDKHRGASLVIMDKPGGKKTVINKKTIGTIRTTMDALTNTDFAKSLFEKLGAKQIELAYQTPEPGEVEPLMQAVIDHYNKEIERPHSQEELWKLFGETIQAFQRIHPFPDANGRTFVNSILNRMLLQHGYPPATFYQPNLFDAFGHHAEVLKLAMQNTLDIYAGKNIFGFDLHEHISQDRQQIFREYPQLDDFTSWSNPRVDVLDKEKESMQARFSLFSKNKESENEEEGQSPTPPPSPRVTRKEE